MSDGREVQRALQADDPQRGRLLQVVETDVGQQEPGQDSEENRMTTRQWNWMKHRRELGLCESCGDPSGDMRLCPTCYQQQIAYQRKRRHNKPWEPGQPGRPPERACYVTKHLRELLKQQKKGGKS